MTIAVCATVLFLGAPLHLNATQYAPSITFDHSIAFERQLQRAAAIAAANRRRGREKERNDLIEQARKRAEEALQRARVASRDSQYTIILPILREDAGKVPDEVKIYYKYVPGVRRGIKGMLPKGQRPKLPTEKLFVRGNWNSARTEARIKISQYKGWKGGYIQLRIQGPEIRVPGIKSSLRSRFAEISEWSNLLNKDAPDNLKPKLMDGLTVNISKFMEERPRGGEVRIQEELRLQKRFVDIKIPNVPSRARVLSGGGTDDLEAQGMVIETSRIRSLNGKDLILLKIDRDQIQQSAFRLRLEEVSPFVERYKPITLDPDLQGLSGDKIAFFRALYSENPYMIRNEPDDGWIINSVSLPDLPWLKADSFQAWPDGGRAISVKDFVRVDNIIAAYGQPIRNPVEEMGIADGKFDGSYWWRYPDQGVSFKAREILIQDDRNPRMRRYERLVETIEGVGRSFSVAGLVPGESTYTNLLASLGSGAPVESGSAKERFMRSYIDGALRIDPGSKISDSTIGSIQITRPFVLVQNGLEPSEPVFRRKVFVVGADEDIVISGEGAQFIDAKRLRDRVEKELQQLGLMTAVKKKEDADFILSWKVESIQASQEPQLLRSFKARVVGTLSLSWTDIGVASLQYQGQTPFTASIAISGGASSEIGRNDKTLYYARALDRAVNSARAAIRSQINMWNPFWTRVGKIDYAECVLTLDSGAESGLQPGDVFTIKHFDPIAGSEAFPAQWDGDQKFPVVAEVIGFDERTHQAICTLGTIRETRPQEGSERAFDKTTVYSKEERLNLLRGVLSPDTKVVFAVPAFRTLPSFRGEWKAGVHLNEMSLWRERSKHG